MFAQSGLMVHDKELTSLTWRERDRIQTCRKNFIYGRILSQVWIQIKQDCFCQLETLIKNQQNFKPKCIITKAKDPECKFRIHLLDSIFALQYMC